MNVFLSPADDDRRRWYLPLESWAWSGPAAVRDYWLDEKTIRSAPEELADSLADRPADWVRQPDAGRPPTEKDLTIIATLEDLVEPERRAPDDGPDLGTQQPAQSPI